MTEEEKRIVAGLRNFSESDTVEYANEIVLNARKAAVLIESLTAELEQTENKLSELLYYVTGVRFSKTDYSTDDMRRFVEDYNQSVCSECAELEQVKRERDAAMEDLRGVCRACIYYKDNEMPFCCYFEDCANGMDDWDSEDHWQWRGVKEE